MNSTVGNNDLFLTKVDEKLCLRISILSSKTTRGTMQRGTLGSKRTQRENKKNTVNIGKYFFKHFSDTMVRFHD